ncbi:MAG: hypothetical protein LIP08_13295 [Bacteroides sp.]|nr:hypothetical protein [Bacteroides sp.]
MKKILLFTVALIACSYSAFSQHVSFTHQTPNVGNTRMDARIVCSEAVTVVFEVRTALQHTDRDGRSSYRVNNGSYMYEYLPAGAPTSIKMLTVKLPKGESPIEMTADNTASIMIISTVNGKPFDTPPLTLYNR